MAEKDLYASPLGAAYSAYMERPWLSRRVGRLVWGADTTHYYESMRAVAEVPAGGTIVDCPCGAGPAFRALRPEADVRYVAADLSPSMLGRARERAAARHLGQVELLEADATEIPLASESADLFLSYWGLHCFADPAAALREAARLLRPGGRLVGASLIRGKESLRQRLLVRPGVGGYGRVGTEAEVRGWLAKAGFAPASFKRTGPMLFFDASRGDVL